jgi:hypothetical protein
MNWGMLSMEKFRNEKIEIGLTSPQPSPCQGEGQVLRSKTRVRSYF